MARYLFRNAHILDAERGEYFADGSVLVEGDCILEVGGAEVQADDAQSFDLAGMTLLPGLIDAHVHVTAVTADLARLAEWSPAYVTARATCVLEGMLRRGFTTVRDVGGANDGLAQTIEEGYLEGPRLLFAGSALSQTGRLSISVTAAWLGQPSAMAWMQYAGPPARKSGAVPPTSSSCSVAGWLLPPTALTPPSSHVRRSVPRWRKPRAPTSMSWDTPIPRGPSIGGMRINDQP